MRHRAKLVALKGLLAFADPGLHKQDAAAGRSRYEIRNYQHHGHQADQRQGRNEKIENSFHLLAGGDEPEPDRAFTAVG